MDEALRLIGAAACGAGGYIGSRGITHALDRFDTGIIEHGIDKRASAAAAVMACLMSALSVRMGGSMLTWALGALFWMSLSGAAYSDGLTKEIYDCVYYPGIAGCIGMLYVLKPEKGVLVEMGIFLVLQFALFRLMYGMSDCIAFSMCSLYLASFGCGMLEYMAVMLLTLVLFVIWQWLSKNIHASRKSLKEKSFLKLKEPDAMIPYILGAMGIVTVCMSVPLAWGMALFAAGAVAVLVFL